MTKMTNLWAHLNEVLQRCQDLQEELERLGCYVSITWITNGQALAITQDLAEVPYRFVETLQNEADKPLPVE